MVPFHLLPKVYELERLHKMTKEQAKILVANCYFFCGDYPFTADQIYALRGQIGDDIIQIGNISPGTVRSNVGYCKKFLGIGQ